MHGPSLHGVSTRSSAEAQMEPPSYLKSVTESSGGRRLFALDQAVRKSGKWNCTEEGKKGVGWRELGQVNDEMLVRISDIRRLCCAPSNEYRSGLRECARL